MHPVSDYMTKHPFTIGRHASLAKAHVLMRENGIRHLPVVESNRVVGIVTERDLHLLETIADFSLEAVDVEQAMTSDPHVVSRDAPIHEVVDVMARHKYGCVVVVEGGAVEGIFTTIDALAAMANLLWPADEARSAIRHDD
jgi:acetoin utilization protein AcuB